MSITVLQIHKRESETYEYIEDKYAINLDLNCVAIADGATQSYQSGIWAQILTNEFVTKPSFSIEEFRNLLNNCAERFGNVETSYSEHPAIAHLEKRKLESGAAAAFLGIQIINDTCKIIQCGDTNLFIVRNGSIVNEFPFSDIDTLNGKLVFLESNSINASFDDMVKTRTIRNIQNGDEVILATDALARAILKNPRIERVFSTINFFEEALSMIEDFWQTNQLEEDDITCVRIRIDGLSVINEIIPSADFNFNIKSKNKTILAPVIEKKNMPIYENDNSRKNHSNGILRKKDMKSRLLLILTSVLFMSSFLNLFLWNRHSISNDFTAKGIFDSSNVYKSCLRQMQVTCDSMARILDSLTATKEKKISATKSNKARHKNHLNYKNIIDLPVKAFQSDDSIPNKNNKQTLDTNNKHE